MHPGGARALRGLEQDPASPGQLGGLAGGGSPLAGPGGEPGGPRRLQPAGLSQSSEDPPWVGAHLLRFTWRGPKLGAVSLTPAQFACPHQLSMIEGCLGQSQTPPLKHISLQEGSGKMETVPRGQEQTRHLGRRGVLLLVSRASSPGPQLPESLALHLSRAHAPDCGDRLVSPGGLACKKKLRAERKGGPEPQDLAGASFSVQEPSWWVALGTAEVAV